MTLSPWLLTYCLFFASSVAAQADTLVREVLYPGTQVVRVRYAVLADAPARKHGTYVAYQLNGLRDSVGRYEEGRREGPWLLYDEYGRASHREHFTDGRRVERVALRRLPLPSVVSGTDLTGLVDYPAADVLLYGLASRVRYPATAREYELSGSADVLVACDGGGVIRLLPGPATHPVFAKAVAEVLPALRAASARVGLLERLCQEDVAAITLRFALE